MKISVWTVGLLVLTLCAASAAQPAAQAPPDFSQEIRDFESNAALGSPLTMRAGTPAELELLNQLADRGLKAAREAVAKYPDSAEAHYLLGSWLLYGYRVVEVHRISSQPETGETTEVAPKVIQGTDDPDEGLAEFKRATDLAPTNGGFLLDYAAALADYDRMPESTALLRAAWAGKPPLTQEEKAYAGLLLSDLSAAEGRLQQARDWIYAALSLTDPGARAVERLRYLDSAQVAAAQAAQAAPEQAPQQAPTGEAQEEYQPEESQPEGYQPQDYGTEEYAPQDYQMEGYNVEPYVEDQSQPEDYQPEVYQGEQPQPEDYPTEYYPEVAQPEAEQQPLPEENQESTQ